MATAPFDAELMTQQVAAIAVPPSHDFSAVRDEKGALMMFSLGINGVFYVVKDDANGARVMVDLGAALGLPPGSVTAFAVTQSPTDSTLYLVVAAVTTSTAQTDLFVLKPFAPSVIDVTQPTLNLESYVIPNAGGGPTSSISAFQLFLGNDTGGRAYPPLILSYVTLNKVHQATELGRVQVDANFANWQLISDVSLPPNLFSVINIVPGNLSIGTGYFCLYLSKGSSQTQLMFLTTGTDSPIQVALECPDGAGPMATFVDADNFTALLLSGNMQGLYYWSAADAEKTNQPGTLISSYWIFSGVINLLVSQTEQDLAIFARSVTLSAGYALASAANPGVGMVTAPLIPREAGTSSPLLSADGASLSLIVADLNTGNLSMLMQDTDTSLWTNAPFYTPSLTQNTSFQSYTVHMTVLDASLSAMPNQKVLLQSPGWVDITANGLAVRVGPSGTPLTTDSDGTLTLLIPTEDISSYVFTVGNVPMESIFAAPITIDPTFKVNKALAGIQHAADLQNQPLQTGGHLMDGTTVPADQIEQAAQAIHNLHAQRTLLPLDGSRLQRSRRERRLEHDPGSVRSGKLLGKLLCGHGLDCILAADSIIDMAWDAWNWLVDEGESFISWAVEQGTKGLLFVVNIGGQVMRWALDGLTEIGKAISWVMDEVLDLGDKIIDWLGFLLNWDDIQATHRSLVAVVNGGLQSSADHLAVIGQQVDTFFDNLENSVRTALYPAVLTGQTANSASDQGPIVAAEQANISSTKGNWAKYHFKHGGAATASSIAGSESSDPLYEAWTNLVEPAFESLSATAETLASDLVLLFQSGGDSLSVGQVLQKLGVDVLLGVIDVVRTLVVGLVDLGALVIQDFKTYMNYEINIPVFSALYKEFISGGTPLSVLDGLCMLVAIPVTIMSKLLTGSAPPDMTGLNYDDLVDGKVTDPTQLLQINHFMNLSSWTTTELKGVVDLLSGLASDAEDTDGEPHAPEPDPGCEHPGQQPHHRSHHHHHGRKHKHKHHHHHHHGRKHGHHHHHLSRLLAARHAAMGLGENIEEEGNIPEHWKLLFSFSAAACGIPTDPSQPGYPLRWISWLIACSNTLIASSVRKVTTVDGVLPLAKAQALAVLHAVLAAINFSLVSNINGLEFTTDSYPGKDVAFTTLRCFSSVFDLLVAFGTDAAVLVPDPTVKAACEVVAMTGTVFGGVITGGIMGKKLVQGDYNYILMRKL